MLRRLIPLAITLALVLSVLPQASTDAEAASTGYVTIGTLNVRTGPSTAYRAVMQVYYGDAISIIGSVTGQTVAGDNVWYRTKSGYYVSRAYISDSAPRGSTTAARGASGERWIDVNLSTLTARAMVGNQAVYTAPIVSGRPGWGTPTGTFRILRRTPSTTMNSATIGIPLGTPGSYYLENVQWTQYFTNFGHAIHGNYWVPSNAFGRSNTSRGCVGMTNADARYFYEHAALGTRVVIHY